MDSLKLVQLNLCYRNACTHTHKESKCYFSKFLPVHPTHCN